jgi:hypothetical protein
MGVEWVTGPGRRIELRTAPKDVSRFFRVRPGLGTHPHADQSIHAEVVDHSAANSILAAGTVGRFGTNGEPLGTHGVRDQASMSETLT